MKIYKMSSSLYMLLWISLATTTSKVKKFGCCFQEVPNVSLLCCSLVKVILTVIKVHVVGWTKLVTYDLWPQLTAYNFYATIFTSVPKQIRIIGIQKVLLIANIWLQQGGNPKLTYNCNITSYCFMKWKKMRCVYKLYSYLPRENIFSWEKN